jgi:hypothetical protein
VDCLRTLGGDSGGEVGGEDVFDAALVGVGPVEFGAGFALEGATVAWCCSFSSTSTFAWAGSGSAILV